MKDGSADAAIQPASIFNLYCIYVGIQENEIENIATGFLYWLFVQFCE